MASVDVGRVVQDDGGVLTGRFTVDVRARCAGCQAELEFQGLPVGVDTHGPTRSPDGMEARLVAVMQGRPALVTDRVAAIFTMPEGRA